MDSSYRLSGFRDMSSISSEYLERGSPRFSPTLDYDAESADWTCT